MQMSKVPIISGYGQYSDSESIGDYSPPEILVHKTSLTPRHFIEFHVLIQERERSCMLIRSIHGACVSNYCSIGFWKCSNSGVICVKSGVICLFFILFIF